MKLEEMKGQLGHLASCELKNLHRLCMPQPRAARSETGRSRIAGNDLQEVGGGFAPPIFMSCFKSLPSSCVHTPPQDQPSNARDGDGEADKVDGHRFQGQHSGVDSSSDAHSWNMSCEWLRATAHFVVVRR